MPTNLTPRVIAGALAAGGSCWGLLLLVMFNLNAVIIPPFLLGYVVTAWYVVRVFRTPPLALRRVMWVVSLAAHGWWLVAASFDTGAFSQPLFVAWWVSASVLSVIGLFTERRVGSRWGGDVTSRDRQGVGGRV